MLEKLWGKGNTPPLFVEIQTGTTPLDDTVMISQKIRKQLSSRPSNITFEYISKGCSTIPQDMCSTMFITVLFVIARPGNNLNALQPKNE